jgi:hypothetical protein
MLYALRKFIIIMLMFRENSLLSCYLPRMNSHIMLIPSPQIE